MCFLCDASIKGRLNNQVIPEEERIEIVPPPQTIQIGQCSIDLKLSNHFARFRKSPFFSRWRVFNPRKQENEIKQEYWYHFYTVTEEKGLIIRPNEVILAMSKEWIKLPKTLLGLITGRSTFSRMGIEVQLTQDLRQPGHTGPLLLQIKNNAPFSFRLYPGMRIAQLLICKLDAPCEVGYDESPFSKYKKEEGGIVAKWFQDPELHNRELISKSTYFKPFLDALLIVFGILSIGSGMQSGLEKILNPLFLSSLIITIIIVIVRIYLYFRKT